MLSMVGSEATLASGLPPPLLGEHTDAILKKLLGTDADAIAELRRNGVV